MQSTRGKLSGNAQPTSVGRPDQPVEICATTELQDRIETWMNQGGVGDDRCRAMNTLRVLVADDDVLLGTFLAEMLEGLGHEVCSIETTAAGTVFSAARCRPDLLIIDVMLGTGSGVSALEQILRNGPVAHVLISGAGLEWCPSGAVVLQKPFREADLVRAMQRAVAAATAPPLVRGATALYPMANPRQR